MRCLRAFGCFHKLTFKYICRMANLSPWKALRIDPADPTSQVQRGGPKSPSGHSSFRLSRSKGTLSPCRRPRRSLGCAHHACKFPNHFLLPQDPSCRVHCRSPRDWLIPIVPALASFSTLQQTDRISLIYSPDTLITLQDKPAQITNCNAYDLIEIRFLFRAQCY